MGEIEVDCLYFTLTRFEDVVGYFNLTSKLKFNLLKTFVFKVFSHKDFTSRTVLFRGC